MYGYSFTKLLAFEPLHYFRGHPSLQASVALLTLPIDHQGHTTGLGDPEVFLEVGQLSTMFCMVISFLEPPLRTVPV